MATYDEMSVEERSSVVDSLLLARQSSRTFDMNSIPPKEVIEEVIWAGIQSPSSVRNLLGLEKDWRRFVVIRHDSPVIPKLNQVIIDSMKSHFPAFREKLLADPNAKSVLDAHGSKLMSRLGRFEADDGGPERWTGVGTAPWLVIIGELRPFPTSSMIPGTPSVAHTATSQALMTMWMKATALGLGFQMVTATVRMTDNKEFCELIGLPVDTYSFDACALGYPDTEGAGPRVPMSQPTPADVTAWLE